MIVLQKFDFKESKYERPQDEWVCGHLADGKPCALGPGRDGTCRVTTACQPRLENGRWQCRRSAQEGGPCQAGPFPDGRCNITLSRCEPQPSLRTKRKRVALWATALAVGLLALILAGGATNKFLMPGPLSSVHATRIACSTCHAGSGTGKMDWVHQVVASVGPKQNAQLCMACHDVGAQPFAPHTHPVEALKQITAALNEPKGRSAKFDNWVQRIAFSRPFTKPASPESEIYCATCHKEHQGEFNDLKKVSNERCQTCHVAKFGSFATSHPQFSKYPYHRRTRIIFDHASHIEKHFEEAAKAAAPRKIAAPACADCHQPGLEQKYMEVKSYETMCSSCHNADILGTTRASGPKGIDFLSVPGLDVATLAEHGIDIGDWPKTSEAVLTPFMGLLLAANGDFSAAGVAGLDLLDLSKASDADLAKVQALAWSVKRIFNRLETTRLETAIGGGSSGSEADRQRMTTLTGAIPHDVILGANREWFPNLHDDLTRHDKGEPTKSFKPPEQKPEVAAKPPAPAAADKGTASDDILGPPSGASPSSDILAPPGPAAPAAKPGAPPARAGAATATRPGTRTRARTRTRGTNADESGGAKGGDDSILGGSGPPAKSDDSILGGSGPPAKSDDSILGGSSPPAKGDDSILGGFSPPAKGDDSILGGSSPPAKADDSILGGSDQAGKNNTPPAQGKTAEASPKPFDPEAWAEFGGWYRQDFTVRYRPSGHADPFLRSWLDFASSSYGTIQETQLAPIFERLAPQEAVGRCAKCHSVDTAAGAKRFNWRPFYDVRAKNRFTTFGHKSHINAVGEKGCATCHELNATGGDYLKTYQAGDSASYVPNFQYLDKSLCATCHTKQAAWEGCTLCHKYHVSEPGASDRLVTPAARIQAGNETR